jgi:hypothetical protein
MTNATTQDHATGRICVDCLMLEANGDWPEWMDADEVAEYRESIDTHPNAGTEMTLGHLHDSPDSQCWHAGESCDDDCDCEHTEFASGSCDMCGTTLAGYRHDVTFWFDA